MVFTQGFCCFSSCAQRSPTGYTVAHVSECEMHAQGTVGSGHTAHSFSSSIFHTTDFLLSTRWSLYLSNTFPTGKSNFPPLLLGALVHTILFWPEGLDTCPTTMRVKRMGEGLPDLGLDPRLLDLSHKATQLCELGVGGCLNKGWVPSPRSYLSGYTTSFSTCITILSNEMQIK